LTTPFGLIHLWIRIQFSSPFPWNYPPLQWLESAWNAWKTAWKTRFQQSNFSKFSGEGGRLDIGRHSADFNPVLSGSMPVPAKSISPRKPMLRNQNTWHVTCSPRPPVLSRPHADLRVWSFPRHSYILSFIKIRSEVLEPPGVEIGPFPLLLAISSLSAFFPWYYGSCIMPPQPPSSTQIHRYHLQAQIFTNPS